MAACSTRSIKPGQRSNSEPHDRPILDDLTPRPSLECRAAHVLPGFGLSLGFTLFYLTGIVLVPLLALVLRPFDAGL